MTPPPEMTAKKSGLAVASLVLGILGLLCIGPLGSVPAIICGHMGSGAIRKSNGTLGGKGLATAGTTLGYLGLVLMIVAWMVLLPMARKVGGLAMVTACEAQRTMLLQAKNRVASEKNLKNGDPVAAADVLRAAGLPEQPRCPSGGGYTIGRIGDPVVCSRHGAKMKYLPAVAPAPASAP